MPDRKVIDDDDVLAFRTAADGMGTGQSPLHTRLPFCLFLSLLTTETIFRDPAMILTWTCALCNARLRRPSLMT